MLKKKEVQLIKNNGETETVLAMVINECWGYVSFKLPKSPKSYAVLHIPSGLVLPYVFDKAERCKKMIEKLPCQEEVTEEYITSIKFAIIGCEIRDGVTLSVPVAREAPLA